jgi:hypothetical protein
MEHGKKQDLHMAGDTGESHTHGLV